MEMTLANNATSLLARQTSQAGAAVESFRNEMVRANEDASQMLGAQLLRLTQKD